MTNQPAVNTLKYATEEAISTLEQAYHDVKNEAVADNIRNAATKLKMALTINEAALQTRTPPVPVDTIAVPTKNEIFDALLAEELLLKMSRGNGWKNAIRNHETIIYALNTLASLDAVLEVKP